MVLFAEFSSLEKLTVRLFKVLHLFVLANGTLVQLLSCSVIYANPLQWKQLSGDSTKMEGKAKSKKTYSRVSNMTHFKCPKLSSTEIMCGEDDANIPELVRFLLDIYAPKNTINST